MADIAIFNNKPGERFRLLGDKIKISEFPVKKLCSVVSEK
jgi:hypothetical protein